VEFPHIQELYDELGDRGLGVVAFTGTTAPDSAKRFIAKNGVTIPLVLAEYKDSAGVFRKYGASNGSYFIVDSAGIVAYSGHYDMYLIRKTLEQLGVK
jgi:hypothetical protein